MVIMIAGASRGLGYALVVESLRRGDTVIAACRSLSSSRDLIELQTSSRLRIVEMDIGDETSVSKAAQRVGREVGHIDAVINNGAIFLGHDQDIRELDIDMVSESLNVNTLGPMRVVKHFVPFMTGAGRKIIMNISSEAGSVTTCGSNGYGYSLSKAALNMFSQIAGHNLADIGIDVLAVHPSRMRTDMGRPDFPDSAEEVAAALYELLQLCEIDKLKVKFVDRAGNPMPL